MTDDQELLSRIWDKDVTLWGERGTPEIEDRLGWLDIASRTLAEVGELETFVAGVQGDGYTDVVVLGMGGSSLAPEVFRRSFGETEEGLRLHVLDTTEPLEVLEVEQRLDLSKTLFVVSSKSGGTIEPNSLFKHFHALIPDGDHFVAITDPDTQMGETAREHGFRRTFVNDPNIGGRYSALSWFGIVPAALAGIDVRTVLERAAKAERTDAGIELGRTLGAYAREGRDKLAFIIDRPLEALGLWAEQLIAESTGKQDRGVLPIADEPLGTEYGDDRVFLHVRNDAEDDEVKEQAVAGLATSDHPVLTLTVDGPADLGRAFYVLEVATAVLGHELGINPFDQPNVQEAKDNTTTVLEEGAPDLSDGDLAELFDGLRPPGYLAVMGYLPYDDAVDEAVARLRAAAIAKHRVATTWGYGPRFLHSTGQYHKGGPDTGRFLQLVHDDDTDADVPGEPYGFRALVAAQADGDLQTLRSHGLPAVRVRLSAGDLAGSIDRITATIEGN